MKAPNLKKLHLKSPYGKGSKKYPSFALYAGSKLEGHPQIGETANLSHAIADAKLLNKKYPLVLVVAHPSYTGDPVMILETKRRREFK